MIDVHIGEAAAQAPDVPWSALIGVVPHLIWAALLVWLLSQIGTADLKALLSRIHKVGAGGVELEFKGALEEAVSRRDQSLPAIDLGRASRRLTRDSPLMAGARLLWVDDEPANNEIETQLFEAAGARVDTQTTNSAALAAVDRQSYDLVISDIARPDDGAAGLALANALAASRSAPAIIFYVGTAKKPAPATAFAITDRPDELVHCVLDALARRRG